MHLPAMRESEAYLLGAILTTNKIYYDIHDKLNAADFFVHDHQEIYRVIEKRMLAEKRADVLTVTQDLEKDHPGNGYAGTVAGLLDYVDSVEMVDDHLANVVEAAKRRRILALLESAPQEIEHGANGTAEWLISELAAIAHDENAIRAQRVDAPMGTLMDELKEMMKGRRPTFISTGYSCLDKQIIGLGRKTYSIIGARPSMGKTAFATNLACNVAIRHNGRVLVYSVEMAHEEILRRAIASEGSVPLQPLRRGIGLTPHWSAIGAAAERIAGAELYINDNPRCTPGHIELELRKYRAQGIVFDFVIVDHIQKMTAEKQVRAQYRGRREEMAYISNRLAGIAKAYDVHLCALSQLNRKAPQNDRGDHRPRLDHLKETGDIEQDADLVLLLHRPEYYKPNDPELFGKAEIIVAKQRNGPVGRLLFSWQDEYCRFDEIDDRYNGGDNDGMF